MRGKTGFKGRAFGFFQENRLGERETLEGKKDLEMDKRGSKKRFILVRPLRFKLRSSECPNVSSL